MIKKRIAVLVIFVLTMLSVMMFYPTVLGNGSDMSVPLSTPISDVDIDGVIGTEWACVVDSFITDLSVSHYVKAKHDGTYLYILLVVDDNTNDLFNPVAAHDWAGVEFDINGDEQIHGTSASPDDFEYCDYKILGGEDWWGKGFMPINRGNDTSVGGSNDVIAAKGFDGAQTIWEFKKKLNSGDTTGEDIAMDPSQTNTYGKDRINFFLAYQDGATGKHSACSHFDLLILTTQQYTLTINSSPTGATVTVDGVPHTTPWSDTFVCQSVDLTMPSVYGGYAWSYWAEDGNPNNIRTVVINEDITLTGIFDSQVPTPSSIGGIAGVIDGSVIEHGLQTWVMLSAVIFLLVIAIVLSKRKKENR